MIGLVEVGLILFLVVPGFTPIAEASLGLIFFAVGVVAGGIACRAEHPK